MVRVAVVESMVIGALLTLGWDALAQVTLVDAHRLLDVRARASSSFDDDTDAEFFEQAGFGSFDVTIDTQEQVPGAAGFGFAEQDTVILGEDGRVETRGEGRSFSSFIAHNSASARGIAISRTVLVFDVDTPVPYRLEVHLVAFEPTCSPQTIKVAGQRLQS